MIREDVIARANSLAKPIPFNGSELCEFLRPMKADERREAIAFQSIHGDDEGYKFLFVRSVCDVDGKRIFTDEDAHLVGEFPAPEVNAVILRVMELNRMGAHEKKVPSTTTPTPSSPSA